jgi:pyruvate dehydrogenase E1 component alpha subunit
LCQNNRWAEHTDYAGGTSVKQIVERAAGYAMEGVLVDGTDAVAMYKTVSAAAQRARSGRGPTLIEAMSYRMLGHTFGSPLTYMPKEYMAEAAAADPLPRLRKLLISRGVSEARLEEIVTGIDQELSAAIQFALASPFPDAAEIRRDVFKQEISA